VKVPKRETLCAYLCYSITSIFLQGNETREKSRNTLSRYNKNHIKIAAAHIFNKKVSNYFEKLHNIKI